MRKNNIGNLSFNYWKTTLLVVFLNILFTFNVFSLSIAGNQMTRIFNDLHIQHAGLYSQSPNYAGPVVHGPLRHNHMNLLIESLIEAEENIEEEMEVFDFHYLFVYHIHDPAVSLLGKTLSALPSLSFQRKNPVSLFILFHSWKNFFHEGFINSQVICIF